jgi:DNA-binding MarR family transcriptional regulator
VKPPYPTEIPPLLPLFLNKRRAKMTFPLQKTEELGLDRPTFIWTINLSYRGARGASAEPGDLASVYGTIPGRWLPMAAASRGAGLAEERDGRWYLTEKGRGLAAAMHEAARAHYATLTPLPKEALAELARLLDRAFLAAAKASEPAKRLHTPFAFGYRGDDPPAGSFAQLDAAIYGLWQVRDDCHIAAWRASGRSGPEVEVLTRLWREEAADDAALADLLTHQRPEDVSAAVARLRKDGLVEREALKTTAAGAGVRQKIEDETDRLFFTPWPDDIGAKGSWIAEKLIEVNTALG